MAKSHSARKSITFYLACNRSLKTLALGCMKRLMTSSLRKMEGKKWNTKKRLFCYPMDKSRYFSVYCFSLTLFFIGFPSFFLFSNPLFLLVFHNILVYLCSHPWVSRLAFKKWYYLTKRGSFLFLTPCDPNDPKVRIRPPPPIATVHLFATLYSYTFRHLASFDFVFLFLICYEFWLFFFLR